MESRSAQIQGVLSQLKDSSALFLDESDIEKEIELLCSALLFGSRICEQELVLAAVTGGTGVGKSTFLNWLLREELCPSSSIRPCTSHPSFLVYQDRLEHVRRILTGSEDIFRQITIRAHHQKSLERLILIDSPDYDSTADSHLRMARLLLHASHKIIILLSPAKYGDQVSMGWYTRAGESGRDIIPILNKIDTVPEGSLEELLSSCADLLSIPRQEIQSVSSTADPGKAASIIESLQTEDDFHPAAAFENQLSFFRKQIQREILSLDEVYGQRSFGFQQVQVRIAQIEEKFWDRHKLLRKDIEGDLKKRLSRIADKKVFYFSKWITKHLFSFVDQIQNSLGIGSSDDADGSLRDELSFQDQIFRNLEISMLQIHESLLSSSRESGFVPAPAPFDSEEIKSRFREEFEVFQQNIYTRITSSFESNITTRHSLLAVSQEVLLSLLFYSFLGPIGFIPGSEQVISGLCYLVYGKLPSSKLPSVMVELENLSKECHLDFENFLRGFLTEPSLRFQQGLESHEELKRNWADLRDELDRI